MRDYVESLKEKHGVAVDEELLASLDFGSSDPAVQNELRDSDAVLATLAGRPFTVSRLGFKIRFDNFHGIEGKPDAGLIRDKVLTLSPRPAITGVEIRGRDPVGHVGHIILVSWRAIVAA